MQSHWRNKIEDRINCISSSFSKQTIKSLENIAIEVTNFLRETGEVNLPLIAIAGNGGSHAEAEHLSAELSWRFRKDVKIQIPCICLTSNSSCLTALSNDISYEDALASYLESFEGLSKDSFLFVFTTSYKSSNIINLIDKTSHNWKKVIFTGPNKIKLDVGTVLNFGINNDTALIQEMHLIAIHILCDMVSSHIKKF